MEHYTVAIFGEAEKGVYRTPHFCHDLAELADRLGHPPEESSGLFYAIQALLYERDLIFFRVREEGYSLEDYLLGLDYLEKAELINIVDAIGIPGVGDDAIITAATPLCRTHHSFLITTEADLYDYLSTASAA